MDQVIDKFGPDVKIVSFTDSTFDIEAEVSISPTFFAWVFQFVGEMKIMYPADVQNMYIHRLEEAQDYELT